MNKENHKINMDIFYALLMVVITTLIVGMLGYINHAQKSNPGECQILFGADNFFVGVDKESIKAQPGFIEYTVGGKKRILSVDANYAILCS